MNRIAFFTLIVATISAATVWAAYSWNSGGYLDVAATGSSSWRDANGTVYTVRVDRGAFDSSSGTIKVSGEILVTQSNVASNITLEVGDDLDGDQLIESGEWTFVTDALTGGSVASSNLESRATFDGVNISADHAAYRVVSEVARGEGTATYYDCVIRPGYDVE